MAVQEYLDKHSLSIKIEEGVNEVVKAKPDEPLSYLVTIPLFHDLEHAVRDAALCTRAHTAALQQRAAATEAIAATAAAAPGYCRHA